MKTMNEKMKLPFYVALISIVVLIAAMFLPYLTATGTLAEMIELSEDMGVDTGVKANPSVMSVDEVFDSVYGDDDAEIVSTIVAVMCALSAVTALFVFLKKPVAIIIFNLLNCGVFVFLNWATKEDLVGKEKYAWGIGYYLILIAAIAVFVGAIWMIVAKKSATAAPVENTTPAE